MSDLHNGNQDLVLAAIRNGHGTVDAIMRATGLDENAVYNAARRLSDTGKIRRYASHYHAVTERCLLAEVWK